MTRTNLRELPKLRDSLSYVYFEHARVEQDTSAIAIFDIHGETHLPAAALALVMLGPGTTITHAAMKTLADAGCTVLWVADGGTRVYGQGMGETRSSVRFLRQAQLHADPHLRAAVVYRMYEMRFAEDIPAGLTIEQLRGREGVRVREAYQAASRDFGVPWRGRLYDRGQWDRADRVNQAISSAAACLNGLCHCAIVSAGYSTALGFIHTGKLLSFVYDVSDLYRTELIIPVAFEVCARYKLSTDARGMEKDIRLVFRQRALEQQFLKRVVADLDSLLTIDNEDVERAIGIFDADVDSDGLLWNPNGDDDAGSKNYADDAPPSELPKSTRQASARKTPQQPESSFGDWLLEDLASPAPAPDSPPPPTDDDHPLPETSLNDGRGEP